MSVIFKCKMCGGDLDIQPGSTIAECLYCGRKQTLPKLDDDKRRNLYDRANHFRQNGDFDKAMTIYEQILSEDNTDAEAYWSLVLCRYGIEYVEDPATHKRIPTVNRTQPVAVTSDEDYKQALHYADDYQTSIYEDEAKVIDEIQRGILEISKREKPFDVFICYKESDDNGLRTHDSVLAVDLYDQLTKEGFKVFCSRITLEDKLGQKYEPYIFAALNSAPVMVVLGTKPEYFRAVWVRNEWSRYLSLIKNGSNKTLIPAYKDMDPYDLPEEFAHLQAQDMGKLGFMQDLIRGIKKILESGTSTTSTQQSTSTAANTNPEIEALLKRVFMFLEDRDFEKANEYCEKVLDKDPENARAYLGKLMVELGVQKQEDLEVWYIAEKKFDKISNYIKAVRFADENLKSTLEEYVNVSTEKTYKIACKRLEKGDFYWASALFETIKGYSDSDEKYKECEYQLACEYITRDSIQINWAKEIFEKLKGYRDVDDEKIKECEYKYTYQYACELMDKDRYYSSAADEFEKIKGYRDADEKYKECVYQDACEDMYEKGYYDVAEEEFEKIKGYRDADEKYKECIYRNAMEWASGKKDKSISNEKARDIAAFQLQRIRGYKDADELIAQWSSYAKRLERNAASGCMTLIIETVAIITVIMLIVG